MLNLKKVGHKIHDYRTLYGLSQGELAEKLFVTRQAVSKWEIGLSAPTIDNLFELCKLFNTNFDDILCLNCKDEYEFDFFKKKDRMLLINKIINKEVAIDLSSVFIDFTYKERFMILQNIKNGVIIYNIKLLIPLLTDEEKKYLEV